jgi:hypothetical protein
MSGPEIEDLMKDWKEAGLSQEVIDEMVDEIFREREEEEQRREEEEQPEEKKDGEPPEEPEEPEDKDEPPVEEESEPPMPSEPGPEDPEDRAYSPERNVEDGGEGSTGSDPQCKPIFNPSVARMKRGETFDQWREGGQEGYEGVITDPNAVEITLQTVPDGSLNMHKFEGKTDIKISSGGKTPLYMPSVETYITEYSISDGSNVKFYKDGLNNVYVKAQSGGRRSVTLEYTVWCKWSDRISNLEYYYQEYDDDMTLYDAYTISKDAGYPFNKTLVTAFRRKVPRLLGIIDNDFFKDLIDALKPMSSPGLILDENEPKTKKLITAMKNTSFKRAVQILAGYMLSFGCGHIPEDGDMVVDCIESREGACRHRALTFFVCGTVIGIPTRYCCSDCHAYPEVYFGNLKRWVGMDLGGCSPTPPKPPEPKPPEDILQSFKDKLIMMGWETTEDRFKKAVMAAQEALEDAEE